MKHAREQGARNGSGRRGGQGAQQGVALAIVVWFIAGMSLLVAGIVMSARSDVRLAQVHYARAQVTAAGDGAINLLLADLVDGQFEGAGDRGASLPLGRYRLGEDYVSVLAIPETMLVDVQSAPAEELAAVARVSGASTPAVSQALANAVVQYRGGGSGRRRAVRLDSIEDLLGARGMNRTALDALRDYITVGSGGGFSPGSVARSASPVAALEGLTPRVRAQDPQLRPLSGDAAAGSGAGSYRVDALLRRGQDVWLRRRWVQLGAGRDSLPWRYTRTEPVRMVPRES